MYGVTDGTAAPSGGSADLKIRIWTIRTGMGGGCGRLFGLMTVAEIVKGVIHGGLEKLNTFCRKRPDFDTQ
jgi:hypothetical protein